jgi:sulfite exporter TauE/SafE
MLAPLPITVFLASLLGSLHCAGMCGAFLAVAVGDKGNWRRHAMLQSAYHGGRMFSYVSLGFAAGLIGRLLDLGSALAGIRSAAAILAGATICLFAAATLVRLVARRPAGGASRAPAWLQRITQLAYTIAMDHPPMLRALLIGLCTTLLPCGWLYAFAATAAGSASPISGAAIMLVFWAGTLPMMAALGAGVRTVLRPLDRHLPVITCVAMLAVGLYTVIGRASLDPRTLLDRVQQRSTTDAAPTNETPACCQTNDHRGT